ncbi:hypothetical protein CCACVL1_27697, partial [Corchorus capsularis]
VRPITLHHVMGKAVMIVGYFV